MFSACKKQDKLAKNEVLGEWKLIEILIDRGDGSGEFEPTDRNITLEFKSDGKVVGNGILCGFAESVSLLEGEFTQDSLILTNCANGLIRNRYSFDKSNLIITSLQCREPCLAKLIKI